MMPIAPALYECDVVHSRITPKKHTFSYKVFMFAFDLDAFPKTLLLSKNRFNLFSIDSKDHIKMEKGASIHEKLCSWLKSNGSPIPEDSKIVLYTFPSVLGYSFNPVSFYYSYRHSGEPLTAVTEVTNTFREMKLFPLGEPDADGKFNHQVAKEFYVSPFSDPNDSFHFKLRQPSEKWSVNIDNLTEGSISLVSAIRGTRRDLTSSRLAWFALKYPLLSVLIILRIHLHALLLYLKKVPYFPKSTPISSTPPDR